MIVLYFTAVFAAANVFAGGGLGWRATWRGRPVWYASIALLGLLWPVTGLPWAAALAGSFLLWRTPGWFRAEDVGLIGHTWYRDAAVMFVRGLLFPVYWWATAARGYSEALVLLAFQALMIVTAYLTALRAFKPQLWLAELGAGAYIGLCTCYLYGVFQ